MYILFMSLVLLVLNSKLKVMRSTKTYGEEFYFQSLWTTHLEILPKYQVTVYTAGTDHLQFSSIY